MSAFAIIPLAVLLAVACCEAGFAEFVHQLEGWPAISGRHCATLEPGEAQWLGGNYVLVTAVAVFLGLQWRKPEAPKSVVAAASIPAILIFMVVSDVIPRAMQMLAISDSLRTLAVACGLCLGTLTSLLLLLEKRPKLMLR